MSFKTGLVDKLQEISGLKVYPENAQEGTSTPYVVYTQRNTEHMRKLGTVDSTLSVFMFELNLIVDKASESETYGDNIESKLKEMYETTVGGEYIQDVEIDNRFTNFEPEVEKYREIIEFSVSY